MPNAAADKEARMQKLFEQIKMLLIVKMLKEDGFPIEIIPNLFIGSMGAAFSKDNLFICDTLSFTLRSDQAHPDGVRVEEASLHRSFQL